MVEYVLVIAIVVQFRGGHGIMAMGTKHKRSSLEGLTLVNQIIDMDTFVMCIK